MGRWATVTVVDEKGRRHSMDVQADSSFDAAHLFLVGAKNWQSGIVPEPPPMPTLQTVFEVVVDGKVHRVEGAALQRWIVKRREEMKGPRGYLFSQRPTLDNPT
ncbi:MAG: hypothetical protein JWN34_369 [Bryobacterales bacterium]|nr:hypothetical protein [Bryobacterales bacterium]